MRLFRLICSSVVSFFPYFVQAQDVVPQKPVIGLWVEAEGKIQPFNSKGEFKNLLKFLDKFEFTDLYCQVYRRGRSWFPSMLADDGPYRSAVEQGFDPLGDLLIYAQKRDIKVHAWLNTLRISGNRDAPLFKIVGPEAALQDNFGNSLLNYSKDGKVPGRLKDKLGTPGIWLDPSNPDLRDYLGGVVEDLLNAYPGISGVHLDMIRFPIAISSSAGGRTKLDFGHSSGTLARFKTDSKKYPDISFKSWKRSQVTEVVSTLGSLARRRGKKISVATIAWPNRAIENALQNWPKWLSMGLLDEAVLMAYTVKDQQLNNLTSAAVSARVDGSRTVMGLGAWLMLGRADKIENQTRRALKEGADGVALFSYSNLASRKGEKLVQHLFSSVFKH